MKCRLEKVVEAVRLVQVVVFFEILSQRMRILA